MITKHFTKTILGFTLGLSIFSFAGGMHKTAYASDMSDIDCTSTKAEIEQVVNDGNFDYTELTSEETKYIYSLYNNDPETIRQLQKQSDFVNASDTASIASYGESHSSMFKGYKVVRGIDVSEWNGDINWKKVKASGISFAIIRVGGRYYGSGDYYIDSNYKENLKNATAAGLDVGVYFYSQAISTAEAKKEATYTMKLISGYNINLPIVMDYEYAWENGGLAGRLYDAHLSKAQATNVIKTFCSTVESKGYVGMLYASKTVITDDMNGSNIAKSYPVWTAQYNDTDTLTSKHTYWQYSDIGDVPGISHATDMNYRYITTPAAPASLAQTESTDSTITLKWSKIPEVYGYQIVRYDSSQKKYISVGTVKGAGKLTFTDKNLQDGQKYTYKVRGYYKLNSGSVYGKLSQECSGITIADTIENFKASQASSSSIKLTWSAIPAATGYKIYRYNSSTKKYDRIASVTPSTNCSYTDTHLYGGTKYTYKVRAYTDSDFGTIYHVMSTEASATTGPGPVSGLRESSSTSNSITMRWNKQNNVDGYIICTWDDDSASWTRLAKISAQKDTTYTHNKLASATQYNYAVLAYYTKGGKLYYTDMSPAATGCTGPASPKMARTDKRSAKSITIVWSKVNRAAGYYVYKYEPSKKAYVRLKRLDGSTNRSYTFTGLKANTSYKFAIRAYTKTGTRTNYSSPLKYSTRTAPATFTKSFQYTTIGSKTYLKWSKMNGVSGYIIYKYNFKTQKYTKAKKITNPAATLCVLPSLSKGYGYRIVAYTIYNNKAYYGQTSGAPVKNKTLQGTIIESRVRLRASAGTSGKIKTELARGTKVKIIGYARSGSDDWYKVSCTKDNKKLTGYVFGEFVRIK